LIYSPKDSNREGFLIREEIWIEKYRPVKLDDVIGQDQIIKRLKSYVASRNLPHLLFSDPPEVEKTVALVEILTVRDCDVPKPPIEHDDRATDQR
jgi:replication factor C small subunit